MITNLTPGDLIAFEERIGSRFKNKEILAPIHLHNGNEEQLISIFKNIQSEDWVFSTWRSHYHCLLKGVPPEDVEAEILKGHSITLCFPQYRVLSSAIVTGSIPIAAGVALDIKRRGSPGKVWCFIGDMTAETGAFHENYKYSVNHDLPITWVIEDNGKSVCTDTKLTWNQPYSPWEQPKLPKIMYYQYTTKYPHAGIGERIQF